MPATNEIPALGRDFLNSLQNTLHPAAKHSSVSHS